jgi:malate-CoA ligase subunit beta
MDIHEYQAKELLAKFGIAIPHGGIADSPDQAVYRANEIGGSRWVVKAQIHSGARGKAGGVRLCKDEHQVRAAAKAMLGERLVTYQTGPQGRVVHRVYIEAATGIERELYLALILDRKSERIVVVASQHGGMDIEEIARTQPESITREIVEPAIGMCAFQARQVAFSLGLRPAQMKQAVMTILGAYRTLRELDATMVEINPLVVANDGSLLALDAKMTFDDNALFRRPNVSELRDWSEEDPREAEAHQYGLNYVALEGNIGCIVNGAGLAMASMDMIKYAGGNPANFLDVGGGATPDRVAKAFKLVLSDPKVEGILVNIFAGINRCDWVAEGVIQAARETRLKLPLVVRLAGTHVEQGRRILKESGLPLITADSLAEAAQKIVHALNAAAPPATN